MYKVLNIRLLLSAIVLLASSGCTSWCNSWLAGQAGVCPQEPPEQIQVTAATTSLEQPPVVTKQPVQAKPTKTEPQPAVITESGDYLVSRIYPCAECGSIRLDKTMPREVELTKAFDYSIKVTNLTDMTLTSVVITESLPENFRSTGADPTARIDGNRLIWEIDQLRARDSNEITVSGMATNIDSLKHCTTVTTPVIPACANIKVVNPKLELTKSAPATVALCDPIPVRFVVANSGTGSAEGVKIVDTLPEGLQTQDGKAELVLDAGTLGAGQSRQLVAELRATKSGTYVNKAVASSATGLSAESTETTTVVGQPLLTIAQTGPERQYLGRPVTYEITVSNKGNAAAKNTVIETIIPAGVTSMKATTGAKLSGASLVWELGTLPAEASKTVRVSYTPTTEMTLTSKATATAYCAESVTALAKTTVAAIPAVLLEVIDIEDPIEIGTTTTYMITVTNQGSATDSNIRISCTLEDNVKYVSSTGATAATIAGNSVQFAPLAVLPQKAKATWRVVVEAVKPGDVRFRVTMNTDQLTRPVEETEATRLYK
jgi:uncharacterized repeat protein (TIGR01451 family)